jgi:hypothetical protein
MRKRKGKIKDEKQKMKRDNRRWQEKKRDGKRCN